MAGSPRWLSIWLRCGLLWLGLWPWSAQATAPAAAGYAISTQGAAATRAADAVLREGGNLFDAAVAASFTARDGLRATWAYRSLVARNLVLEFIEERTQEVA